MHFLPNATDLSSEQEPLRFMQTLATEHLLTLISWRTISYSAPKHPGSSPTQAYVIYIIEQIQKKRIEKLNKNLLNVLEHNFLLFHVLHLDCRHPTRDVVSLFRNLIP